jgi:hypothetical protein
LFIAQALFIAGRAAGIKTGSIKGTGTFRTLKQASDLGGKFFCDERQALVTNWKIIPVNHTVEEGFSMERQDSQFQSLLARTRRLERWLRLSACAWLLTLGLVALSALARRSEAQQAQQPAAPQPLRVSELVVVDPKGVERVRIGGDLPDAIINGRRVSRGEKAAGVLIYDATGQERGGYVTFEPSGNAALTLDTRRQQVVLLAADPESGAALQLRHGGDSVELRSDVDGSRFTAVQAGQVVAQQPSVTMLSASTCQDYKGILARRTAEQVMNICRQRYTDAACKACLGKP